MSNAVMFNSFKALSQTATPDCQSLDAPKISSLNAGDSVNMCRLYLYFSTGKLDLKHITEVWSPMDPILMFVSLLMWYYSWNIVISNTFCVLPSLSKDATNSNSNKAWAKVLAQSLCENYGLTVYLIKEKSLQRTWFWEQNVGSYVFHCDTGYSRKLRN